MPTNPSPIMPSMPGSGTVMPPDVEPPDVELPDFDPPDVDQPPDVDDVVELDEVVDEDDDPPVLDQPPDELEPPDELVLIGVIGPQPPPDVDEPPELDQPPEDDVLPNPCDLPLPLASAGVATIRPIRTVEMVAMVFIGLPLVHRPDACREREKLVNS